MATTSAEHLKSFVISFNPRNKKAIHFLEIIKMMDFFKVEETPYDPTYVAKVKAMDKRTFKSINRDDLWK